MKDSYIMHCDYGNHFELLTDAELGRLIRDVNNYVKNGVLPQYTKEDRVLNMAFSFMKTNIDIETEKYIKKCEKIEKMAVVVVDLETQKNRTVLKKTHKKRKKPILILILKLILKLILILILKLIQT